MPYFIFPAMASSPFIVTKYLVDAQYIREYPHATSTQDAPLKLAVKKYTPVDNQNPIPGDVTLIGVTGTGLPKVGRKKELELELDRNTQLSRIKIIRNYSSPCGKKA